MNKVFNWNESFLVGITRLWIAADELCANSKLKSSEYSVPVLGLVFLRYADHEFQPRAKPIEGRKGGEIDVSDLDIAVPEEVAA